MLEQIRSHLRSDSFRFQVGSSFGSQAIALVAAIVQAVLIARLLGPGGKGEVAVALLVPVLLAQLLDVGLTSGSVYFVGGRRIPTELVGGVTMMLAATGAVLGGAGVAMLQFTGTMEVVFPGVSSSTVLLSLGALPMLLVTNFALGIIRGLGRVTVSNVVGATGNLLNVAAVVTALLVRRSATSVVVGVVVASSVTTLLAVVLVRASGVRLRPTWHRGAARALLGYGLRGYVGNVLQYLNYRFDILLVNIFLGPAAVGIYTVATRLAEVLWSVPNALSTALFPRSSSRRPREMVAFTPRVIRAGLGLAIVGALSLALVGEPLIRIVFSEDFVAAYQPLVLLLPGAVAMAGAKIAASDIAGRGYPEYNSITAAIGLLVTVILDLVLIPAFEIAGAALASTVAYIAVAAGVAVFFRRLQRNPEGGLRVSSSSPHGPETPGI